MGLDIKVYHNIHETTNSEDADFEAYVIDSEWEWKIKNLNNGGFYIGDLVDRSISYPYSTHGEFRKSLIQMIDRNDLITDDDEIDWDNLPKNIPFVHLINFADNEGCLDYEVSELIFKDFKEWASIARKKLDIYNQNRYFEWYKVFDLARKNGVVVFS